MLSGAQLAGGNSTSQKAEYDYYATDPNTVELFLERFTKDGNKICGDVWECACGEGNISEVLIKKCPEACVISTDIIDRGYGVFGSVDFLQQNKTVDVIITNPPFSLINAFINHGLKQTRKYLILLAKIQTLETVERKKILENSPLKYVYVHSKRQATWKNGEPLDLTGKKWATTMCLAWFVFDKEYAGEPIIRFI